MDITDIKIQGLREFYESVTNHGYKHPIFIVSRGQAKRAELTPYLESGHKSGALFWECEVPVNPSPESIADSVVRTSDYPGDAIIAIGGGSAIDLAKAISALRWQGAVATAETIYDALQSKNYKDCEDTALPITAVPTTAGTGSEITGWGTVWSHTKQQKLSVDATFLKPCAALIVPKLTMTMPKRLILSTALDALCHALEAFWALRSNPLSQELSIRAVTLISENLKPALKEPNILKHRTALCMASVISALSFAKTRTTACHSISYPLTFLHGIEHGLACVLTLAGVAARNSELCDLTEVLKPFGGVEGLRLWLDEMSQGITELRLTAFGVTEQDIDAIVEKASVVGRIDNNPAALGNKDIRQLLLDVL